MRSLLVGLLLSTTIPLCHLSMEGRIDRFFQTEMERQHIPGVAPVASQKTLPGLI